jgi:hypothetical protein
MSFNHFIVDVFWETGSYMTIVRVNILFEVLITLEGWGYSAVQQMLERGMLSVLNPKS